LDSGNTIFGILKLRRDPEGGAPDKLVVLNVNDTSRDVAVDDVESKVQCFWPQAEGEMDLNEEINETRSHVPPNFRLLVHRLSGRHGESLHVIHVVSDLVTILLLKKNTFSAKRQQLCLTLALVENSRFGGAWGPSNRNICGKKGGFVRF
jgi:hypothetical protein